MKQFVAWLICTFVMTRVFPLSSLPDQYEPGKTLIGMAIASGFIVFLASRALDEHIEKRAEQLAQKTANNPAKG